MKNRIFLIVFLILVQKMLFGEDALAISSNEKRPTVFYLVRHGQTDWNVERRLQGQIDIPLNETGRHEAREISNEFAEITFHALFSSDLERAAETARILNEKHLLDLSVDARLRERNYGAWEGRLSEEFTAAVVSGQKPEDVESDETVRNRALSFLRETAEQYPGSTILVVTHGGMMRSLLAKLLPTEYDIKIPNAGHFQMQVQNGQFQIKDTQGVVILKKEHKISQGV